LFLSNWTEQNRKIPTFPPQIDFAAEYPIIPSRPSELRQLLSGVDEVLNNIKEIDFKGLSDQFKSVGKATEDLLAGKKMNSIMTNLESTSASMERAVARIDSVVAEGRIEEVLTEARDSLVEAKNLIAGVRKEVESLKLADTAEKTNQLVEGIDRRSRAITTDLRTVFPSRNSWPGPIRPESVPEEVPKSGTASGTVTCSARLSVIDRAG